MDQALTEPAAASADTPFNLLPEGMADLAAAGGPVVAILAILSVIATAIGILKLWQFASSGLLSDRLERRATALWRDGRPLEALALVQGARAPVAATLALAIRGRLARDIETAQVREEVARYGATRIESLQSYLRPLEVIGSLAPLLGLFGTVLGMIEAFRQMEAAGSQVDPSVLSGGIWEALLTTAVGLAVAIPAVALLNWLERTVEKARHRMEDAVTMVFAPDLSSVSVAKTEVRGERQLQSTGR